MGNMPRYSGASLGRMTPIVHNKIPILEILERPSKGHGFMRDCEYAPLTATTDAWATVTVVNGTITDAGEEFGAWNFVAAGAENDGVQMQHAESFSINGTNQLAVGARIKLADADQSDLFMGLCTTDTAILASLPNDIIGFNISDGSAVIKYLVSKDGAGTATTTGVSAVDATYVNLDMLITAKTVKFYVDGVMTNEITTGLPDDEILAPSLAWLVGDGTADTMTFDYLYAYQWDESR